MWEITSKKLWLRSLSYYVYFVTLLKTWTICSEILWTNSSTSAVWNLCIHNKWKVSLLYVLRNTMRRRFDAVVLDCLHPVGMNQGTKVRSICHLTCQTYRGQWSWQTLKKVCFAIYKDVNTHFTCICNSHKTCKQTKLQSYWIFLRLLV